MSLQALESTINGAFDARDGVSASTKGEVREAVDHALEILDKGEARVAERRVRLQRRMVDLVDVGEIVVGRDAVQGHHAAHGGAEAQIVILLDLSRLLRRHVQPARHEFSDPRIDLLP